LQHHIGASLRQYLLLIRLPNAFTAPSNVLAGYFATTQPAEASGLNLAALMVSSGLLYVAGIALNDYYDIEIDRKERPSRPLPSGNVPKNHAVIIAMTALIAANAIALLVGPASLAVSLALTAVIIAYDYRLKHTRAGPLAMGGSRFLNVILGASPAISAALLASTALQLEVALFAATSLFVYVVAITLLSRKEVGNEKPSSLPFMMVFALIAAIAAIGLASLRWEFLISLSIFAAVMAATFRRHIATDSPSAQKAIRNMVIAIIVLDSVFISGTAGLPYGLATLLFIVPAVILAKKLYVT
jgi:4-hydroxybenzoate polyprenyltransferase